MKSHWKILLFLIAGVICGSVMRVNFDKPSELPGVTFAESDGILPSLARSEPEPLSEPYPSLCPSPSRSRSFFSEQE